jgi:hypothetical protein
MKNQICALFIAVSFSLVSAGTSQAMSSLIAMSEEALWPSSSTPNGDLVYNVTTVGRAGSGVLNVTLSAGGMPPGVTVTFSPSVLRFTGNALVGQTATMTVSCPGLIPIDCYPFTITGTAQRESITITNLVCYTPQALAVRLPTLMLDKMTNGVLWLKGSGATGQTYQIQATESLANPIWTPLGPSTADANGRFTFFTSQTPGMPVRFFRAVTTP